MRDRLSEALGGCGADYAEVRFEHNDATTIVCRGEEVDRASTDATSGGIVRACVSGGWGVASFSTLDDLPASVVEAVDAARQARREGTQLAPTPVAEGEHRAEMARDFRGVGYDDKLRLARRYSEAIVGRHEAVRTSTVQYAERFRSVHFASTDGSYFFEERPMVTLILLAAAADATVQQAHESVASAVDYGAVTDCDDLAVKAADRAVALLDAPKPAGGAYTVVLNPRLAGVFCHEAFGHLSEGDFLYENPPMRELMRPGRRVGVEGLSIVDDGTLGETIGSGRYDDEGTPRRRTDLVRDGVLVGHLHSRETAARMGAKPTGNARAIGPAHAPIVRMTNTYIEGGKTPLEEMIRGIDEGIYAVDAFGGQTMMEMFTFSAAYAHRIRNGQLGELLRDVVLTGNVFETLDAIDAFGDDPRIIESAGGCGKDGQGPLPVTFGSPHLRIRNVVVG